MCVRKVLALYCVLVLTKVYSNPQTHSDFYFANLIKPLELIIISLSFVHRIKSYVSDYHKDARRNAENKCCYFRLSILGNTCDR